MLTVVTAAGVLAEFVVGSLVLVPMSAGRRTKPVERLAAAGSSTDRFEPCRAASGPPGACRDSSAGGANPARATESLWRDGSQNGCPDGFAALSVAPRAVPAVSTPHTGCAP